MISSNRVDNSTVLLPICDSISPIIDQKPSADYSMLRPVVDRTLVVPFWPFYVFRFGSIVKCLSWYVGDVSESIPLCSRLRVELILVIICKPFSQGLDLMLELLAVDAGVAGTFNGRFRGTISPLLISFEAAATRVGVRRLSRPIFCLM